MSRFSIIETKLTERFALLKALHEMDLTPNVPEDWGYGLTTVDLVIMDPFYDGDPTIPVDFSIGVDIGFKFNEDNETFDFICDIELWDKDVSVEEFVEQFTKQYNYVILKNSDREF